MARFECPECGYLLPSNVERVRNKPLAVVGNVLAGKSHYIAAFLQQLKTDWIAKADGYARLTCLTPEIEKKYTDEYVERLFLNKRQIQGTHRATRPTVEPLIYELSVHPSPEQSPIAVNLIIYDSSGEDFLPERLVEFAGFVF